MTLLFLVIPVLLLAFFIQIFPNQPGILYSIPWVPTLDINISFSLSKLSLFMGLLISLIGTAITFYATKYMKTIKYQGRFWFFFMFFMFSMIGLVFSENLIALFLFWEATSICSFFLIGHTHEADKPRESALTALLVTGIGGIFLLVGFIGLYLITGSYEITHLIQNKEVIAQSPLITPTFIFIMIGVMTKSAQFPFHFWLPQAMTGPAPVSSFLHSATMVKAGVFLLAKLFPILSLLAFWEPTIVTIGLITFIWGGIVAVKNFDIKSILANTTISALGCLVALLGMAKTYPKAMEAFILFFIAHAFYKAALFMCAGVIEKKFKSKDIREIRMSFKEDIFLSLALIIACFSMMGLPPTIGFVAKETFLDFAKSNALYLLPLMIGGLLNFLAAGKILYFLFLSKNPLSEVKYPNSTTLLSFPPFLLGIGTLAFTFLGHFGLNEYVNQFAAELKGTPYDVHVSLWHGFNTALLFSSIIIILGIIILIPLKKQKVGIEDKKLFVLSPTEIYNHTFKFILLFADYVTRKYQSGYLRQYFIMILGVSSLFMFLALLYFQPPIKFLRTPVHFTDVCIGLIIIFSTVSTLVTESKIWAITQIGIVGTGIILFFIFYGAPDLALTQLLVEIFTLTIFVFALHRLPFLKTYSKTRHRIRDIIISACFGILMGLLTYISYGIQLDESVAKYYAENTYLLAHGKNIVNVILVDFRGFDTLGEVSVILMAAIGVYILMRKRGESNE